MEFDLLFVKGDETAVLVEGGFSRANLMITRFELESVIRELEEGVVMLTAFDRVEGRLRRSDM